MEISLRVDYNLYNWVSFLANTYLNNMKIKTEYALVVIYCLLQIIVIEKTISEFLFLFVEDKLLQVTHPTGWAWNMGFLVPLKSRAKY